LTIKRNSFMLKNILILAFAAAVAIAPVITQAQVARPGPGKEQVIQANLEKSTAPIRTQKDLAEYLSSYMAKSSPLDVLDPQKKSAFLSSLVFTENGVASLRHDILSGLTAYEAYRILGLFGWQSRTSLFPGLSTTTQADQQIMDPIAATDSPSMCLLNQHECEGTQFNRKCKYKQIGFGYVCDKCTCTGSPE
jgi:hypothetical protein